MGGGTLTIAQAGARLLKTLANHQHHHQLTLWAQALNDLLGGHIDAIVVTLISWSGLQEDWSPVAITGTKRASAPEVPT